MKKSILLFIIVYFLMTLPVFSKIRMRVAVLDLEAKGVSEAGEMMQKFGRVATGTVTNIHLILDLEEMGANETRIHFCANADAVGQMKRIYEAVIKTKREEIETQFIKNLENALAAKVVKEESPAKGN